MASSRKAKPKATKRTVTAVSARKASLAVAAPKKKTSPVAETPLAPAPSPVTAANPAPKAGNSWIMIGLIAFLVLVAGEVAWMTKSKADRQRTLSLVYEFGKRTQDAKDPEGYKGVIGFRMDKDKRIYVIDPDLQRVTVWDSKTKNFVMTLDRQRMQDPNFSPRDVAIDNRNTIYILDGIQQKIFVLNAEGKPAGVRPAVAISAIAADSQGNLLASNWERKKIDKLSPQGELLKSFGQAGSGNDKFSAPSMLAVDGHDNCYVLDGGKKRIFRFLPDGTFDRSWELEFVPDNLTSIFAGTDNVYVSSFNRHMIWGYSPKGKLVLEIKQGYPIGGAVDDEGFFYLNSAQGIGKMELSKP